MIYSSGIVRFFSSLLSCVFKARSLMVDMLLGLIPFNATLMADNGSFMVACPDCMARLITMLPSDILICVGVIITSGHVQQFVSRRNQQSSGIILILIPQIIPAISLWMRILCLIRK